ncbi:Crp/Fnr family transcriptional regulator [Crateriforma spongiae]|uniref:Crp/Fnr family transcriptional regulator n=1 Tax=Crateriforma spongiae TaxID=2724528 RepID=UPI0039B09B42
MKEVSDPRSVRDVLAACGLFQGLDDQQMLLLCDMGRRCRYRAGETVFQQQTPCPGIFVVDRGLVRVFRSGPNGQQHVLHLCGPNQTFAEVAAIGGFPLPASATAAESTECVLIPTDRLHTELSSNHALCHQLLTGMAFWVRHFVQLVEDIALRDAMSRVTRLLCDLPCDANGRIALPGSKKDIANHLNLTSETFSRVLRRLMEKQVIESEGSRAIRVLDADALGDISDHRE